MKKAGNQPEGSLADCFASLIVIVAAPPGLEDSHHPLQWPAARFVQPDGLGAMDEGVARCLGSVVVSDAKGHVLQRSWLATAVISGANTVDVLREDPSAKT